MGLNISHPTRIVVLEDGRAVLHPTGNVELKDFDNRTTHRLGVHDLAELLRQACGSDGKVLAALAWNMERGHRFTMNDINDEEPF